jgi:16S rRNA C967 or C1407 C5-methylase (RsmB/RsmF family)
LLKLKKFFPGTFDKVLLDPPCSALGLRPKLFVGQTTMDQFISFSNYQKRFIKPVVDLLKPGGTLVYSTCTLFGHENEGMVRFILKNHPEMKLQPIQMPLGSPGLPNQGLAPDDCAKVRRFDPTVIDTTGFFIAVFRKDG